MQADYERELLGFTGRERNYAVELSYVEEICFDIKISKIPCLPHYFIGMFHYRGAILPVAQLEEQSKDEQKRQVLLVLSCNGYRLGVVIPGDPYVISFEELKRIEHPEQPEFEGKRSISARLHPGTRLKSAVSQAPGGLFCIPQAPTTAGISAFSYTLSR